MESTLGSRPLWVGHDFVAVKTTGSWVSVYFCVHPAFSLRSSHPVVVIGVSFAAVCFLLYEEQRKLLSYHAVGSDCGNIAGDPA